jgi:hypothetical protein
VTRVLALDEKRRRQFIFSIAVDSYRQLSSFLPPLGHHFLGQPLANSTVLW